MSLFPPIAGSCIAKQLRAMAPTVNKRKLLRSCHNGFKCSRGAEPVQVAGWVVRAASLPAVKGFAPLRRMEEPLVSGQKLGPHHGKSYARDGEDLPFPPPSIPIATKGLQECSEDAAATDGRRRGGRTTRLLHDASHCCRAASMEPGSCWGSLNLAGRSPLVRGTPSLALTGRSVRAASPSNKRRTNQNTA